MKPALLVIILAISLTTPLTAVTAKNFPKFHFEDGIERTPESFAEQTVVAFTLFFEVDEDGDTSYDTKVVESIKKLAKRRETQQLHLSIIVIANQDQLHAIKGLLTGKGVDGIIFAASPLRGDKLNKLSGTIDPDGTAHPGTKAKQVASINISTTWPISNAGLTDEKVRIAWWHIVNGNMNAYTAVVSASEKHGETGEQAAMLAERVHTALSDRFASVSGPITNFAAYQEAEVLLTDLITAGTPELKTMAKQLKDALEKAQKDPSIAAELKARDAYYRCMKLATATIINQQQDGAKALNSLHQAMPNTLYGALAGRRYPTYSRLNKGR